MATTNKEKTLELKVKEDREPIPSWDNLCRNPDVFLTEIATRLVAFGSFDPDSIIISENVPSSSDRTKIWIKTSFPYGIGFLIEGSYKMDYGLSGLPVKVPFLALATDERLDPLPARTRILSSSEISDYGIPKISDKATNPMSWFIFEPLDIEF